MPRSPADPSRLDASPRRMRDLSSPRRRLVACWQELGYGRVEDLVKCDGEPVWSPPPRILQDVIIGEPPTRSRRAGSGDFAVKDPVAGFFAYFERAPEGARFTVYLQDGLPVRFVMERPKPR